MSPVKNARVLFNEMPKGYPDPEKTLKYDESQTIDLDNLELKSGDFLVKTLILSIDPYMRGKMRDPSLKSYSDAYVLGEPVYNFGVGLVVQSKNNDVKAGDHLYGLLPFQEYTIKSDLKPFRILQNAEGLPWSAYVGVCGMPGKTAYMGWKEHARAKKGETVFVTTGAGPVGSLVIQLAKLEGLKVIASAGSDEKVEFMRSIGADIAFNYKTTDTRKVLEEHGPIDIYWDHVGGESLEIALDAAARFARFVECGMISQYNGSHYAPKNLTLIIGKCLSINGFIVGFLESKYANDFYKEIPAKVKSGEIKFAEDVTQGLQGAGKALYDVQVGKNKAKSIILVAEQ